MKVSMNEIRKVGRYGRKASRKISREISRKVGK
jgi:hypothetical protein